MSRLHHSLAVLSLLAGIAGAASAQGWQPGPALPLPTKECPAVVAGDDVWMFGGRSTANALLASVRYLDSSLGAWVTAGAMPEVRSGHAAAYIGGKFYLAGGFTPYPTSSARAFDPATGAWWSVAPMPAANSGMAACTDGAYLYVFGGGHTEPPRNSAYRYDPDANAWTALPALPHARKSPAAAFLGGRIYVLGGHTAVSGVNDATRFVDVYDVAAGTWSAAPDLPLPVTAASATTFGGRVYLMGGADGTMSFGLYSAVWSFAPGESEWRPEPSLPVAVVGPASAALSDSVLIALGGEAVTGVLASTFRLTPCRDPVAGLTGPASGTLVRVGTPVTFTARVSDGGSPPVAATWIVDGTPLPGAVDATEGTAELTHVFTTAGVYHVSLTVTNACGREHTAQTVDGLEAFVVAYDPTAGFVTGGGWLDSPPGAYAPDPAATGRANFGFVSRYRKGATAPSGETEFQFKAGRMNFHGSEYEWLVVTGGGRAQYKGFGSVNGVPGFAFLLTVTDGDRAHAPGPDRLRMKVWNVADGTMVYDNQPAAADTAAASTAIGGGAIVIHDAKGDADRGAALADGAAGDPRGPSLAMRVRSPVGPAEGVRLRFDLNRGAEVRFSLFDLAGRRIAGASMGRLDRGAHDLALDLREAGWSTAAAGLYLVRLEAAFPGGGSEAAVGRLVLVR